MNGPVKSVGWLKIFIEAMLPAFQIRFPVLLIYRGIACNYGQLAVSSLHSLHLDTKETTEQKKASFLHRKPSPLLESEPNN